METTKRGRKVALLSGFSFAVILAVLAFVNRTELRTWYLLWRDFESLGRNVQGYCEYRHRETGIVFVRLPGGTFEMGSPETESDRRPIEGPVHEVTLSPFLIAKYEVSQAEWKKVMGNNPSEFKGDALPVETVSWRDCQEFCKKSGHSLPTEAQWEYACRAGVSGPYAGTGKLDDMGWYGKYPGTSHPVGEKAPNDFGLHDMHGNVWEWCQDIHDRRFYSKREAHNPDPVSKSGSECRVQRGGGWDGPDYASRSALRHCGAPSDGNGTHGFRPVMPLSREVLDHD